MIGADAEKPQPLFIALRLPDPELFTTVGRGVKGSGANTGGPSLLQPDALTRNTAITSLRMVTPLTTRLQQPSIANDAIGKTFRAARYQPGASLAPSSWIWRGFWTLLDGDSDARHEVHVVLGNRREYAPIIDPTEDAETAALSDGNRDAHAGLQHEVVA